MESKNNLIFPLAIYSNCLAALDSVSFSKREIEIIACILDGRSTKEISRFLDISPKTAEVHVHNIMKKLNFSSRNDLVRFIQNSDKFFVLKKYYPVFLTQIIFERSLKRIASLNSNQNQICFLYSKGHENISLFLEQIKNHSTLAGIKTSIETREAIQSIDFLVHNAESGSDIIYVIQRAAEEDELRETLEKMLSNREPKSIHPLILWFVKEKRLTPGSHIDKVDVIDFSENANYYYSFFEILKTLLPHLDLAGIIEEFKQKHELVINQPVTSRHLQRNEWVETRPFSFLLQKKFSTQRPWNISIAISFICLVGIGLFTFTNTPKKEFTSPYSTVKPPGFSARSDLILPNEATLLNRLALLEQIDKKFKAGKGIQTLALMGIGGAGKTTLARQYASHQKEKVVWEMNAETHSALLESFAKLARSLAKAESDKKLLRELEDIKDSFKREEELINFVREHLKLQAPWFLIYDNVEKFSNIQKYFPLDVETWGQGRVILTARNSTIQNNKQINHVIDAGELDNTQKLSLFTQIMGAGQAQISEAISFLEKIPPFPLDVSTAAYYLKTTNTPYANYLEQLDKLDNNFEAIQEDLLKGAGDYVKTRSNIITLSLQKIITNNNNFADLLLFISLLDSQYIPRDLLTQYKNDTTVDNFIYQLKKHSLIASDSSSSSDFTFSMHRSIQGISCSYLIGLSKLDRDSPIIKSIVYILDDYADQAIEQENFARMRLLASHLEKALNHSALLTDFLRGLLNSKLGSIYYFLNNDQAKSISDISLQQLNKAYAELISPAECLKLARSLLHIGIVYTELRFNKEAKEILERVITIYGKEGLKNYIELSWALSHVGNLERRLGNYETGKDYLEKSVSLHKQYGQDDKRLARTLTYLGVTYRGLGLYSKAIQTLDEGLVFYKKNDSDDHIRVGWIFVQLGNVYRSLGEPQKAKEYFEKGLTIYRKYLPESHINVGLSLAYLGNCYRDLGDYKKSLYSLENSLKIHQQYFDEKHHKIGWILLHLANTYKAMGHIQEAQKLYEKVLKIYLSQHHQENIESARLLRDISKIYLEKNYLDDAENFINRSLKILRTHNHVDAHKSLEILGEIYLKKSNLFSDTERQLLKDQALETFHQALKITEKNFSKDSIHIERIRSNIRRLER